VSSLVGEGGDIYYLITGIGEQIAAAEKSAFYLKKETRSD
jgi:hypothetical protein